MTTSPFLLNLWTSSPICPKFSCTSLGGSFFMIMFVNSFSRWMKLYGMRRKSDTLAFVKKFLADMSGTGVPRSFRMDNGGEFVSRDFIAFCDNAGIRRTYTAPGTPQQNGPAESAIRVNKAGHAARLEARRLFPKIDFTRVPGFGRDGERLRLESCHWAAGGFNRSPTKANVGYKSPYELFTGRPPPLQIVPFSQSGYMRVMRARKMDPQAVLCCYLNNGDNHHESAVKAPPATSTQPSPAAPSTAATPSPTATASPAMPPATPQFTTTAPPATPFAVVPPSPAVAPLGAASSTNMPPLTTRIIRELDVGRGDMRVSGRTRAAAKDRGAERSTSPGGSGPAHRFGLVSLQHKATLLSTLTTRGVVDRGRKEIPSSAGGREGAEPGGRERGGKKPEGLGEEVPFACATLLASREDIDRAMMDIDPPEVAPDLPQCYASDLRVPKTDREAVSSQHADLWIHSVEKECRDPPEVAPDLPQCYASDLRVPKTDREAVSSQHADLWIHSVEKECRGLMEADCGETYAPTVAVSSVRLLAAMACGQNLSRHFDIKQAFVQSDLDEDVFMRLPEGCGLKLSEFDQDEQVVSWPFRELIGSLMWVATQTRPDIARGSVAGLSMEVFADADYASKAADRRYVSGGLVICAGGCISWFSRTQECVTLSTTKAEYVSLVDVMKEVLFLRQVRRFMLPEAGMPCIPVFEDNQGAIQLAQNPNSNSNSKHIDVRHHFIRELVGRKEISIFHVESAYQHADFLTKALNAGDVEFHRIFVMSVGQEQRQIWIYLCLIKELGWHCFTFLPMVFSMDDVLDWGAIGSL
ncbi:unnamed protein product [Ectocarpus sp. CCAP 1310/34]|nr:unnamed protein product [Ectocarpus sp. CCAP 1310/34]